MPHFDTLTPAALVQHFGLRSKPGQKILHAFGNTFGNYQSHGIHQDWESKIFLSGSNTTNEDSIHFARRTYYALIVGLTTKKFLQGRVDFFPSDRFLDSCDANFRTIIRNLTDLIGETLEKLQPDYSIASECCDFFKPLYQNLFSRQIRHKLGEYYTPDWLANHILDQLGYDGDANLSLLDPSCGSGTFLMAALHRWRKKNITKTTIETCFPAIAGFDISPLATLTARANYLIALADISSLSPLCDIPVYTCDSISGEGVPTLANQAFDLITGNPPWIAWDNLPNEYRLATKSLWERFGLFSLSGKDARHGGGKKDLAMLMLYVAAERYLRSGGTLGMVITQSVFQTKGAGDGFRCFKSGCDGEPLRVLRVDDMSRINPFDGTTNRTAVIFLQKGFSTVYPVPYFIWHKASLAGNTSSFQIEPCSAVPIDRQNPSSPWFISYNNKPSASFVPGRADYVARLGANTGGANSVYWLSIVEDSYPTASGPEPLILVRNIVSRGKRRLAALEHPIESGLLYPLLRWGDISAFSAVPRDYILVVQDPQTRTGIEESLMRSRYPYALQYLYNFYDLLVSRAAYRRYQSRAAFYSMYNIGPYTFAPIKVVWRRMDTRINAAVVECVDDPYLGYRPIVPQETCVLIACESSDEAHYLCAILNSTIVNEFLKASEICGGKSFGTPGILNHLPVKRFQPENQLHVDLAQLSRAAHSKAGRKNNTQIQPDIDRLASELLQGR